MMYVIYCYIIIPAKILSRCMCMSILSVYEKTNILGLLKQLFDELV